jgi:AcrR family transcriptional regulator
LSRRRTLNKRVEQGLATREEIIRVATRLFAEGGYEATSTEVLLEALGISRGALYHHFRGKHALFEAVLDALEARLAKDLMAEVGAVPDPRAALKAGAAAWLRLAIDPAVRRIALIDAPAVLGWETWRAIDARHGFGLLKASIDAAARAGQLKLDDPGLVAHLLLAAMMEAALVVARADVPAAAIRSAGAALDKLIDGLFA